MSHISNKSTTISLLITTSSSRRYLNKRSTADCLKTKSGWLPNKSKRRSKSRCNTSKNTIWTPRKWLHKELKPVTKDAEVLLTSQSPLNKWTKARTKPNLNTKRSLSSRYKSRSNARSNKNGKEKLRSKLRSRKCWKRGRNLPVKRSKRSKQKASGLLTNLSLPGKWDVINSNPVPITSLYLNHHRWLDRLQKFRGRKAQMFRIYFNIRLRANWCQASFSLVNTLMGSWGQVHLDQIT